MSGASPAVYRATDDNLPIPRRQHLRGSSLESMATRGNVCTLGVCAAPVLVMSARPPSVIIG